jgi:hypothetical protein
VTTEDRFTPDHQPLPLFLSAHAYEHEEREQEERGSLLLLNASVLVLVASLVGMAILLAFGNPSKVLADLDASLTDILALQPNTVQSTPTIQSSAETKALPPTESGAPARNVATAFDTARQGQADIGAAPPGALLKQFQDWAAEEDARAQIETVRPAQDSRAAQDARAQALQNAQARFLPARKR